MLILQTPPMSHNGDRFVSLKTDILSICDDVGRFWIDLGTILKLPPAEVVNIEDEFRYNRDRAWKVMKRWLQMKGREATMGILADALEQMKMRNAVEKLIGM